MGAPVSDAELEEAMHAYMAADRNYAEAGRVLNMPRSTVQHRVAEAVRRNVGGAALLSHTGQETPPGTEITKVSQHFDKEGNPSNLWLQMRPLRDVNEAMDAIHSAFKQYDGFLTPREDAPDTRGDLLTVYPIPDLHLGMLAWRKETGEAYDIDIATNLLREKLSRLVQRTPPSEKAVLLNLGDFFHADNNNAATPEHGNHLDVDSRHQKVLHRGVEIMLDAIELARGKHDHIIVRCLPGNHDPISAVALGDALYWATSKTPEVTVDIDPSPFWAYRFGQNMLAAHHGHMVKPSEFSGVMASNWPDLWGATDFHYGLMGHIHRATRIPTDEKNGAEVRTLGTIAAKDAWNRGMGHASNRTLSAIVYDVRGGVYEEKTEVIRPGDLK